MAGQGQNYYQGKEQRSFNKGKHYLQILFKYYLPSIFGFLLLILPFFSQAQNGRVSWEKMLKELYPKERNKFMQGVLTNKVESDQLKGNYLYNTLELFEKSVEKDQPYEKALLVSIGTEWIAQTEWERANKILYQAQALENDDGWSVESKVQLNYSLGDCAFYYRQYENAATYMKTVISETSANSMKRMLACNILGLCERNAENYRTALDYFEKAFAIAKRKKDEVWQGILSGNKGYVFLMLEDFNNARLNFEIDYHTSTKFKENLSALAAACFLAKVQRRTGDTVGLYEIIHDMDSIFVDMHVKLGPKEYYQEKMDYFQLLGKPNEALKNSNLLYRALETEQKAKSQEEIAKTKFRIDFEKNQALLSKMEQKREFERKVYLGVALLLLTIAFAILNSFRQRSIRRTEEKKVLLLENEKIKSDFENSQEKLKTVLHSLIQKNHLLVELNKELHTNQDARNKHNQNPIVLENWLSEFNLATEESWHEFKRLFSQMNPDFFPFFEDNYPQLTIGERRHLALIHLRLEKDEIAKTLGISAESVRKANLRLRKKLRVESKEELMTIIRSSVS